MSYLSCAGGFGVEAKYLDLVPYIGSLGHDVLDIEVHAIHYATDNEVVWPAGFEVLPRLDALADARGWQSEPYYSTVQSADVDGDGRDEILARAAVGLVAWTFSGNSWDPLPGSIPFSDPAWAAPQYYRTIKTADLDGDGRAEVYARSAAGIGVWKHDGTQWNALPGILPLTDASGWANPEYYTTLQAANIDGLPGDELLGRAATGMFAWKYQSPGWQMLPGVLPFSDAAGWKNAAYYATIQSTDLDNDGVAEVFARTAAGIIAFRHSGTDWIRLPGEFPLTDAQGWDRPRHYETIRSGDLDGDGRSEILARGAEGLTAWEYRDAAWKPKIPTLLPLTDAAGWDERRYFSTMRVADLDGDGRDELLARGKYGLLVYRLQGTQWETLPSYLNYADRYGWDAVAYFGTLQTANVDGKPGREILARSAAGLEVRKLRPNPLLTSNPNRSLTVVAAPAQPATLVWDDFADFVVVEQSGKATGEAWVALEGQPTRRNGRWELPLPTTSAAHRFYRLRVP
ncbi:MAG: FG-GAP repeat domain-containing protein [Limisphaerales bacterium]